MSWEFMIHAYRPQHDRVRPLLDDGRAMPVPEPGTRPTAAQLVAAFAEAGLHGQLGFEIAGLELPQQDGDDYDHARYLGTVYMSSNTPARRPDAPVREITLYKPGESTLAATLAVRHLLGAVVVIACDDDLEDSVLLVRPDDDPAALAAVWQWP
ncbi:hypothetical protein [Catellatospora methionotrophica]|nr:hypothetical protein [Catellatospora methionotrophica]